MQLEKEGCATKKHGVKREGEVVESSLRWRRQQKNQKAAAASIKYGEKTGMFLKFIVRRNYEEVGRKKNCFSENLLILKSE